MWTLSSGNSALSHTCQLQFNSQRKTRACIRESLDQGVLVNNLAALFGDLLLCLLELRSIGVLLERDLGGLCQLALNGGVKADCTLILTMFAVRVEKYLRMIEEDSLKACLRIREMRWELCSLSNWSLGTIQ